MARPSKGVAGIAARLLVRGQTNFVKSLFKLNSVYRPELLLADHARPVAYEIPLPPDRADDARGRPAASMSTPRAGRAGRAIDAAPNSFVDETRIGADAVRICRDEGKALRANPTTRP